MIRIKSEQDPGEDGDATNQSDRESDEGGNGMLALDSSMQC